MDNSIDTKSKMDSWLYDGWLMENYPIDNTRRNIQNTINKIQKLYPLTPLITLLMDLSIIGEFSETIDNISTKHGHLCRLISLARKMQDRYPERLTDDYIDKMVSFKNSFEEKYQEYRKSNKSRANVSEENLVMKDFYDAYDRIEHRGLEFLMLACIVLMPPRRLDWRHCVFVDNIPDEPDKKVNYIILGGEYVVLRFYNYKNTKYSKKRGIDYWERTLNNDLFVYYPKIKPFTKIDFELFGLFLRDSYKEYPRKYLFPSGTGGLRTDEHFSKWAKYHLQQWIHKKITFTNARTLFCTLVDEKWKSNVYERELLALDMDHTFAMAMTYIHIPPETKIEECESISENCETDDTDYDIVNPYEELHSNDISIHRDDLIKVISEIMKYDTSIAIDLIKKHL